MQVSIIIPVYNAESFVGQAVQSALDQPETAEVILVEDGSNDSSLEVCEELARLNERVRLVRHSDGGNHKAAASRNVGLRHARNEFITFLDADDYFLPGRFSTAKELFSCNPQIDGVYEAMGVFFENLDAERLWKEQGREALITMSARVEADQFFEQMSPVGAAGRPHLSSCVIRRTVFNRVGDFDEHLPPHEDTAMLIKLSGIGYMVPGRLDEPVCMRRIHDHNTILAPRSVEQKYWKIINMWYAVWQWSRTRLSPERQSILLDKLIMHASRPYKHRNARFVITRLQATRQLLKLLYKFPTLATNRVYWTALIKSTGISSFNKPQGQLRTS